MTETWIDLPPRQLVTDKSRIPVTLSLICERIPRMQLLVRRNLIDGLDWFVPGAKLSVRYNERGTLMRVQPGGAYQAMPAPRINAKSDLGTTYVRLPLLPHIKQPVKRKPEAVEFDNGNDWLELVLPLWAQIGAGLDTSQVEDVLRRVQKPAPYKPHRPYEPPAFSPLPRVTADLQEATDALLRDARRVALPDDAATPAPAAKARGGYHPIKNNKVMLKPRLSPFPPYTGDTR